MTVNIGLIQEGHLPYTAFAEAGITPASSMEAISDALYIFMRDNRVEEVLDAFDQLQRIEDRLFIDFFLYRVIENEVETE